MNLDGSRSFHRHLDDDEEIIMIVHKHWLIGFKYLFFPLSAFAVGWAVLYVVPFTFMFYVVALWCTGALVYALRNFYDYYLDAWIITDQGIIDVEWHGWFHRQSSRVLYSDIQGVSYEIQGVLPTMLRYGEISVEKISTGNAISLDCVPRPRVIESVILQNMEGYLRTKNLSDEDHVRDILAGMIAREVQLETFDDEEEYDDENYDDSDDDE